MSNTDFSKKKQDFFSQTKCSKFMVLKLPENLHKYPGSTYQVSLHSQKVAK